MQHLYDLDKGGSLTNKLKNKVTPTRQDSVSGFEELLRWCQRNTASYRNVSVTDFTQSWRSGLALCALIHHHRPRLIDMSRLKESEAVHNNELAFSVVEKELGVPRVMSPDDFANGGKVDKLSMVLYLTQIQKAFSAQPKGPVGTQPLSKKTLTLSQTQSAVFFLNKLKHNSLQRQKEKLASQRRSTLRDKRMGDEVNVPSVPQEPQRKPKPDPPPKPSPESIPPPSPPSPPPAAPGSGAAGPDSLAHSEECYFCAQRVYVLERISAEGLFFHRSCFKCQRCGLTLRLGGYSFDQPSGRFYCELHSEELALERPTEAQSEIVDNHTNRDEEQDLSSDYSPAPSDEEFEHSLDCAPSRRSLKAPDNLKTTAPPEPCASSEPHRPEENSEPEAAAYYPVPKPRLSRQESPQTPVAKPRTIHLSSGDPSSPSLDQRQSMKKLQLSDEEKSQLASLEKFFSADSDSETPCGSSSCSSSSATVTKSQEEEGYWSGSSFREKKSRRCFKRKEIPGGQSKTRSKFSPWNLSSPRISRDSKLSVLSRPGTAETTFTHAHCASENDADDDDEDEDEMFQRDDVDLLDEKFLSLDPLQAQKFELMKMRTLERRAKTSELQRLRKAQSIQRRLEEIEVTFKDLEVKGVQLERDLRGEAGSNGSPDLIENWIQLVHEKNALVSEESELMVASRQLELEDKQSMLEMELRKFMEITEKSVEQEEEEERILQQMISVVDMRDSLVSFLEEKRLTELSEEQEAFTLREAKRHSTGAAVNWA